jgi:Ni/Fe-hydrogenase subunit HybB-like protein
MNRFNVNFLAQSNGPGSYFPSLGEFALSVGLVSLAVFLYRWAVISLPIMAHEEAR